MTQPLPESAEGGLINRLLIAPTDSTAIQFLRYLFVGGAAFVVDFGVLWLLTDRAGLHYLVAAALGFLAGLTTNYFLSVRWVFSNRRMGSAVNEFLIFAGIGLVGLALNELIMWGLTDGLGVHYLGSKIVSAVLVYLWNFGARKFVLFR